MSSTQNPSLRRPTPLDGVADDRQGGLAIPSAVRVAITPRSMWQRLLGTDLGPPTSGIRVR